MCTCTVSPLDRWCYGCLHSFLRATGYEQWAVVDRACLALARGDLRTLAVLYALPLVALGPLWVATGQREETRALEMAAVATALVGTLLLLKSFPLLGRLWHTRHRGHFRAYLQEAGFDQNGLHYYYGLTHAQAALAVHIASPTTRHAWAAGPWAAGAHTWLRALHEELLYRTLPALFLGCGPFSFAWRFVLFLWYAAGAFALAHYENVWLHYCGRQDLWTWSEVVYVTVECAWYGLFIGLLHVLAVALTESYAYALLLTTCVHACTNHLVSAAYSVPVARGLAWHRRTLLAYDAQWATRVCAPYRTRDAPPLTYARLRDLAHRYMQLTLVDPRRSSDNPCAPLCAYVDPDSYAQLDASSWAPQFAQWSSRSPP